MMEDLLRPIYQERASKIDTLGIIMVEKNKNGFPSTDRFDTVLLVVVKERGKYVFVKHYEYLDQKATLYTVDEQLLKDWLQQGTNKKITDWILNGKILFDRNEFIVSLKEEFKQFPLNERRIRMGVEFGKLIRRYQDGKSFFEQKQFLDAYNNVIHALHHLARLAIVEKGFHPEVTVWNQVRQIDPQIYKLYIELIESEEQLEKRLELLFLASEFLIHSRARIGGGHLLDVLNGKSGPWLFSEILLHPELEMYNVDLEVLLEFLVDKHLVKVERAETKGPGIYHRNYIAVNE